MRNEIDLLNGLNELEQILEKDFLKQNKKSQTTLLEVKFYVKNRLYKAISEKQKDSLTNKYTPAELLQILIYSLSKDSNSTLVDGEVEVPMTTAFPGLKGCVDRFLNCEKKDLSLCASQVIFIYSNILACKISAKINVVEYPQTIKTNLNPKYNVLIQQEVGKQKQKRIDKTELISRYI
ncbi:MAG: hypothetical protein R3Y21_01230 [Mycoplasmatota bacterium]